MPPDRIFRNEDAGARMLEKLPLLVGSELVVEWNQRAARKKNGVRRNQPLGLIRHDDAGTVARCETSVLQRFGERMRARLEITICQAFVFAFAVRFDQTH